MHLISFSLLISSNTSSPSPHLFSQTDAFRIQTKAASFQLQDFPIGIARSCDTKALLINHFLAEETRSAQGFSNVTQQRGCSTLPPCLGVIRSTLLPARTWPRAICRFWLPTPAPSCAELLLSLCSLWLRASPSSSRVPGKNEPSHKPCSSKI